jgi:hypothetical protein
MPFAGLVPLHTDRPVDEIKDIRGKLDVVRLPRHLGNTAGASPGDDPGGDPDDLDKENRSPLRACTRRHRRHAMQAYAQHANDLPASLGREL